MAALAPHALSLDVVNVALVRTVPAHRVAAFLDIVRRSTHADAVCAAMFQLSQVRIFPANRKLTPEEQGCSPIIIGQ